jgi:hypothetical protein
LVLPADGAEQIGRALVFMRAADQAGLTWEEPTVITTQAAEELGAPSSGVGGTGRLPEPVALKLIGGRPVLLLRGSDYASSFYLCASALDPAGTAWQPPRYVAWSGPVGSAMSHRPSCGVRSLVDFNGQPAFLLYHDTGGYFPEYSLSLCREKGGAFVDTDLRQLPFDRDYPFFAELEGPADATSKSVSIAAPPQPVPAGAPTLALVSLRSSAGGRLVLRAAYTADGEQWGMTPEFDFSDSASRLTVERSSIRCEPADTPDGFTAWLELRLRATLPGRTELRDTRIRLR